MKKNNTPSLGILARMKESVRKGLVSVKRNPQLIPMAMLLAAFLVFSMNLTDLSDTTAKIQGANMGLAQFTVMLLSLLSMVCLLNAFPRRKKPNVPMIVLMFAMFGIMILCDVHYTNAVYAAVTRPEHPIEMTDYIISAYSLLNTHMYLIGITAVLVAALPVYSKLLKKINTSIQVEDNGAMGQIEIGD